MKNSVDAYTITDDIATRLVKFDHATQDKLAKAIIKYPVKKGADKSKIHREFIRRYADDPLKYPTRGNLETLIDEVKGIKKVKLNLSKLSPQTRKEMEASIDNQTRLAEERRQAAKIHRIRRKKKAKPLKMFVSERTRVVRGDSGGRICVYRGDGSGRLGFLEGVKNLTVIVLPYSCPVEGNKRSH